MSRKNCTEREKRELLTEVDKYKAIIENKSTNSVTVEKKNLTWEKIAQEYNSSAENPRTKKQLNTAYQNLKRLTRQKTAEDNMQNYIEKQKQIDLKKIKKDKAEDKKAIMSTGGGSYTPVLSEVGAQMLALMGDQVIPLSNNSDSATDYFAGNNIDETCNDTIQDKNDEITILAEPLGEDIAIITDPPVEEIEPVKPIQRVPPKNIQRNQKSNIYLRKKKVVESSSSIKRKFYKKKLECALIEKKTNLMNYKIALKKVKLMDLEIKIKELEYASKANKN